MGSLVKSKKLSFHLQTPTVIVKKIERYLGRKSGVENFSSSHSQPISYIDVPPSLTTRLNLSKSLTSVDIQSTSHPVN